MRMFALSGKHIRLKELNYAYVLKISCPKNRSKMSGRGSDELGRSHSVGPVFGQARFPYMLDYTEEREKMKRLCKDRK